MCLPLVSSFAAMVTMAAIKGILMYKTLKLLLIAALSVFGSFALAANEKNINTKILEQGVPTDALNRLNKFLYENRGRSFNQDTYTCEGKDPESVRPCEESKRRRSSKTVTLANPQYVAIIDFSAPSTQRRFYFINRKTGEVNKYYVSHGIGSGKDNYASRFSNTKDSRQTSLGIYLTGEVYQGSYGKTLRMYGLQKSNDEAYNRDIVLHGAWYVGEDFINSLDPKTGLPRGRLGVSWGCPALSLSMAEKLIPYLQGGSVIFHYHPQLLDEAQNGREVRLKNRK